MNGHRVSGILSIILQEPAYQRFSMSIHTFEGHIQALRDEIDDLPEKHRKPFEKIAARMTKTLAEVKGRSEVLEPVKAKRGKKKVDAEAGEEAKIKRAPNAAAQMLKRISPDIKRVLSGKPATGSIQMLKIVGRLRSTGIETPTDEQISAAIAFLQSNPDHLSDTQKSRSAKNSEEGDEKPKAKRGRPSKKAAEKAAEKPVEKPVEKESFSDAEEEEEEEEEEEAEAEEENTHLEQWSWKDEEYLKDLKQEVYTSFGEMKWIGTFNGKKIVKGGEMPEHVRKFLATQN